jgi:hypothetical protein
MNKEEFQKYVIAEAKKYLFSTESKDAANIQENTEEKVFKFKVKHDKGTTTLSAKASSQEEAKKKLMNAEGAPASAFTPINESEGKLNPSSIKNLAEEIKKINKKIDLRNPLISESNESLIETILSENKSALREREVDVDDINKKKHIGFQNEGEKDKWNRMLGYNIPNDEERP